MQKRLLKSRAMGGNIAVVNGKLENCRKTQCNECNFNGGTIRDCEIKTRKWANSEYVEPIEPQVDWSRVPVDTPILVRHSESWMGSEIFCKIQQRISVCMETGHYIMEC